MSLRRMHIEELPEPPFRYHSPPLPDNGALLELNVQYAPNVPVVVSATMPTHLLFEEEEESELPPVPGPSPLLTTTAHMLFEEEEEPELPPVPGPSLEDNTANMAPPVAGPSWPRCVPHPTAPRASLSVLPLVTRRIVSHQPSHLYFPSINPTTSYTNLPVVCTSTRPIRPTHPTRCTCLFYPFYVFYLYLSAAYYLWPSLQPQHAIRTC
ncbi:hypothetical protein DFH07DRAFT_972609 [Mycena maculata]|uniref:Uncharacterized protein n=1 Tax=Mycena maculata TaxID=230809 RepID=A0AAD7MJF2_9AGAR|nr:hypothetical protein DFH07DRAFT_972609 [Mycena maculata]